MKVWQLGVLLAACSGTGGPSDGDFPCDHQGACPGLLECSPATNTCVDPGPPPATCTSGQTACAGQCVTLASDSKNCGACGQACSSGQACVSSTCVTVANMCLTCPMGVPCVNGQCDCQGKGTFCTTFCADTTQSTVSCGACLKFCANGGQVCRSGQCACPPGQKVCAMSCTATGYDVNNCGDCALKCATGQKCDNGTCVAACSHNPSNACGDGKCWDVDVDPKHCGAMCKSCSKEQSCVAGSCQCPAATAVCGTNCYDLQRDPRHCGTCTKSCVAGEVCTAGACQCAAGLTLCGGKCVDLESDAAHCGACGTACTGNVCSKGSCTGACAAGLTNCSGACANLGSNRAHCGSCTTVCGVGKQCFDAKCRESSPARGCTSCPCDDCDYNRGWLCCPGAAGLSCVEGYRCP